MRTSKKRYANTHSDTRLSRVSRLKIHNKKSHCKKQKAHRLYRLFPYNLTYNVEILTMSGNATTRAAWRVNYDEVRNLRIYLQDMRLQKRFPNSRVFREI